MGRCKGKNLFFSTKAKRNIAEPGVVFISFNTPTKKKGIGADQACDLKLIEAFAREVANYSRGNTIILEKSSLPVKTLK